jgi:serine/threonine protein phosphatase PrpC
MHTHLKECFTQSLTNNNYKVMETKEGYLLKRYTDNQPWQSLRGGTTCTIIAIIDKMLYCSNVGDSTATLCSKTPIFNPEKQLTYLGDSATPSSTPFKQKVSTETSESEESEESTLSKTMEIIANHSPDNPSEFCRLRQFQQRLGNPLHPASHLVYDSKLNDKVRCAQIFTVDSAGNPSITNNGTYCKNVRYEFATLLTTPMSARFSESLAFTRSIGDFYLQTYGVTYCPEIQCLDLTKLFDVLDTKKQDQKTPLCLVVASDGVWDNWNYEDVTNFVLSDLVLESSNKKEKTAAELLIQQNDVFAKANFGNSSDNATAIVVYLNRE